MGIYYQRAKELVSGFEDIGFFWWVRRGEEMEKLIARLQRSLARYFHYRGLDNPVGRAMEYLGFKQDLAGIFDTDAIHWHGPHIYPAIGEIWEGDQMIDLAPEEFETLYMLIKNPNKSYVREKIHGHIKAIGEKWSNIDLYVDYSDNANRSIGVKSDR